MLKSDLSVATNLISLDPTIRELMELNTRTDIATRVVPQKQQPGEGQSKPLISIWARPIENLGGSITSYTLMVDVYTPLLIHRRTGIGLTIASRVKVVLDRKRVGRGLRFQIIEPDRATTPGWHKATVQFHFNSTSY